MSDPHPDLTTTMRRYAERSKKELGYFPHQFLEMLNEQQGFDTAISLILGKKPSSGFYKMAEFKRLDITVEALVLQPAWSKLFGDDVLQAAYRRLDEFGYEFPEESWFPGSPKSNDNPSPQRVPITVDRIVRDGPLALEVKILHDHKCQLCDLQIVLPGNRLYAEAHHIRPLGNPHDGPDIKSNLLCVCPNCHVMLDYAAIPLNPANIRHINGHQIDLAHIAHHNQRHSIA
jgi:hypothetical protein